MWTDIFTTIKSHTIKSLQKLHSHTKYLGGLHYSTICYNTVAIGALVF